MLWPSLPASMAMNNDNGGQRKSSKSCVKYLRQESFEFVSADELENRLGLYTKSMIKKFNEGMVYYEHGEPYDHTKIQKIFDPKTNAMALHSLALIRQYPESEASLNVFNVVNEYIDLQEHLFVFPDNVPIKSDRRTFYFKVGKGLGLPFIETKLILMECYIELLKVHGPVYRLAISRMAKEAPLIARTEGDFQTYEAFHPHLDYLEKHVNLRIVRHLQRQMIHLGNKFRELRKRKSGGP